ncbi:MAG: glycosyltransferase [Candidatus Altiarchaeales archaeon]|nr:MAG: glycosyltransferase [Candidatus Altiarchaeales archaeon]HDO82793.1 glycosyltransferase [Candidatus Altiarchaeales archaeon]HEX55442.1 glycosyltransferase [Candidatus Altiarchaeales archaeon]
MDKSVDISIIIPVLNEENSLVELHSKLRDVMDKLENNYEIIFVDDGSTDKSFDILKEINSKDSKVKIIKFRKNFGQSAAMKAGFDHAGGDIIVTMDSDLQNDPRDIPELLRKIREGFDVVSGWRINRKDPITKRIPSKISNFLARHLTGVNIHDFGCTLKAYRKEVLEDIELHGEMHRYIPALVAWKGFKISEVKVNHNPRKYGKTKYNWKRFIKGILDLILITFWQKYSHRPIHIFGGLGIILITLGIFEGIYSIYLKLFYRIDLSDHFLAVASFLSVILGVQFLISGILADICIKNYYRSGEIYNIEKMLE